MLASVNAQDKSLAGYGEAPAHGDRGGQRRLLLVTALILLPWALHNGLLLPWELSHLDASVREPAFLLLRAALWLTPPLIYLGKNDPRSRASALGLGRPSW